MPETAVSVKRGSIASGLPILVVEDDRVNQRIAREMLRRLGCPVQVASDGAEALRIVRQQSFAAVLMDIQIPVLDGYETTRRLRKDPRFKHLPIIAMTACNQSEDAQRCLDAGMNDYVVKPVDWDRVLVMLEKWVSQSPPEACGIATSTIVSELEQGLTQFPGIDARLALRRASGNQELATSLLRMFAAENRDSSERIRSLLQAGRNKEAHALVHKIKGSAGTIAAGTVAGAALALERAFSTGADWELALKELERHLDTVIQGAAGSLEESVDSSVASVQIPAPEQVFPLLQHLDRYLTENNMQALDCFRDLHALLRGVPVLVTPLCRVVESLERLDFVAARARLQDVSDVIGRIRRL